MKMKTLIAFPVFACLLMLGACGAPAPAANTQATIDAAAQATGTAQQNAQATNDAAAQATSTQIEGVGQSAIATAVQATLTAQPTPDYSAMTETELAALANEAVNTAMTDAATASESTAQAASDGTITPEEVAATTTILYQGYYEIAYAEERIAAYSAYYGEYAEEAANTLNAMEDDLAAISQSLAEINAVLSQGAAGAGAAVEQLNAAANNIRAKAGEAKDKAKRWSDQVRSGINKREVGILNMQPNQVENDRIGALIQAHDFLDAFKNALTDGKFSPAELSQIGQLGANARASLLKDSDTQSKKFSAIIEGLTRNAARGEWGSARVGADVLQRSLPERPKRR